MRALRDANTRVFGAMLARRRQVVAMLVAENNRLGRALREVHPRIEAHIAWLEQELSELDGALKPESTEGGRRGSVLKWTEGASVNLG